MKKYRPIFLKSLWTKSEDKYHRFKLGKKTVRTLRKAKLPFYELYIENWVLVLSIAYDASVVYAMEHLEDNRSDSKRA